MAISDRAQEILETLWVEMGEHGRTPDVSILKDDPALKELEEQGCLRRGDRIILSEKGSVMGKRCVRRHRLAERLLVDILGVQKGSVHDAGCRFEHALIEGLEDRVCVLLGHPKKCPHGRDIPEGPCCSKKLRHLESVVLPLSEMQEGQSGKIAYLHTEDRETLKKMIAMGAMPGSPVKLHQKSPSYVFEIGQAQFAVDKGIADDIQVWVSGGKTVSGVS